MSTDKEKGKHPIEGFEHVLTIDMLIEELNELKKNMEFEGNSLIYVAYRAPRGPTVVSGISSVCINGRTIQLNEENFDLGTFD